MNTIKPADISRFTKGLETAITVARDEQEKHPDEFFRGYLNALLSTKGEWEGLLAGYRPEEDTEDEPIMPEGVYYVCVAWVILSGDRQLDIIMAHNAEDALDQYEAIQWAASGVDCGTDDLTAERSEDDDD